MNFYLTFGLKYRYIPHPTFSLANPDGYVLIHAESIEEARDIAFTVIGEKWSSIYTEEKFNPIQGYFPVGCIKILPDEL